MLNINFVPDDYIQNNESCKTNLMYLVLFGVVMAVLGGAFLVIKVRQKMCSTEEKLVNAKIARAQEAIEQFEQLQTKRKAMMKTALTTIGLLEPVPRSLLLASLTNNLPAGVSLTRLNIVQKEPIRTTGTRHGPATSKYQTAQAQNAAEAAELSQEKLLDTHIDIEGIAPSDLQVAAYIERLGNSVLLDSVALVESKEKEIEDTTFRQFKLKAMLDKQVHLTKDDIQAIRAKGEKSGYNF